MIAAAFCWQQSEVSHVWIAPRHHDSVPSGRWVWVSCNSGLILASFERHRQMWCNESVQGIRGHVVNFSVCAVITNHIRRCCTSQFLLCRMVHGKQKKMYSMVYGKHHLLQFWIWDLEDDMGHLASSPTDLPPLSVLSHPLGKIVDFGKIAKRAPFPPSTHFLLLLFPHCLVVCSEKRNHRPSKDKEEGRREMKERGCKTQNQKMFNLFADKDSYISRIQDRKKTATNREQDSPVY